MISCDSINRINSLKETHLEQMPPLKNPRHEKFVQCLLEGKSATEAHELAGYRRDDGNATRLRVNPKVRERLAELQSEIAKEAKVTVESLIAELEEARQKATSLDQLSAATAAIMGKAKISGLLVQKMEIGAPGSFDKCESVEAIADEMLLYQTFYRPVTGRERQGLIDLLNEQGTAVQEYFAALRAKPVNAERIYSQRQQELDRGRC